MRNHGLFSKPIRKHKLFTEFHKILNRFHEKKTYSRNSEPTKLQNSLILPLDWQHKSPNLSAVKYRGRAG